MNSFQLIYGSYFFPKPHLLTIILSVFFVSALRPVLTLPHDAPSGIDLLR